MWDESLNVGFPPPSAGMTRSSCITYSIPYNVTTKEIYFNKSKPLITSIVPPLRYTYSRANTLLRDTNPADISPDDDNLRSLLHEIRLLGEANGLRNQYFDINSSEWLVSFCMNVTCVAAAWDIHHNQIPALYRNKYNERTFNATDNYIYNPVVPLNDYSTHRIYEYGYVRVTSPGRRIEDYLNSRNLYCHHTGKYTTDSKDYLGSFCNQINRVENEIYNEKRARFYKN